MLNTKQIGVWVLGICAVLGGLAFFGFTPFGKAVVQEAQSFGSVIESNVPWFTNGYKYGNSNALFSADMLTLSAGVNQASWQNQTGTTVVVDLGHLVTTGTASSTAWFNVGTSTTATVTNVFTPGTTAPMWSQLVSAFQLSTSTVSGIWADNIVNHKTNYPAEIMIANGQYLIITANTYCTTNGACETATSTTRGWTAQFPFKYHYGSLN